jgi:hypothetical protein
MKGHDERACHSGLRGRGNIEQRSITTRQLSGARADSRPRSAGLASPTADCLLHLAAPRAGAALAAVTTAAAAAVRADVGRRLVAVSGRLVAGSHRIAHTLVLPAAADRRDDGVRPVTAG